MQRSNPLYQTLEQQRTKLRKSRVCCLMLRQKIDKTKRIRKQKMKIKKQLFYRDIVNFANVWLKKKNQLETVTRARLLKEKEIELARKLMDLTAALKDKQKTNYGKKDGFNKLFQIEFTKLSEEKPMVEQTKPEVEVPPKPDKFFNTLQSLFDKTCQSPPKPKFDKVDYSLKTTFDSNYTKVRILDNKLITPTRINKNARTLSKEERSKVLDAKIQKVVQNFNKKMFRKVSSKHADGIKVNNPKTCSPNTSQTYMEVDRNVQSKTGATQDLEVLNLLSQDESEMKFVSQPSQTNSQLGATPNESQSQPQKPNSKEETKASTFDAQIAYDKLPLSFLGQVQNKVEANGTFKKPEPKHLGRNGQFSMIFGAEEPRMMGSYEPKSQTAEEELMPLKFGEAQYDFGNITHFSQNDYSGEFHPNIMSPQSPPTDTEIPMNFELPNANKQSFFSFDKLKSGFGFQF